MDLIKGYVALVLHAHLPYVRHPDQDNMLEERWLFEAISETLHTAVVPG
jgi:1,4-alpha-glucan branching enzyme